MNKQLEAGIRLYHAHRFEQALAEFREAEKEMPPSPELDYYLGLCLTQLARYEEALLSLEKVVTSQFSFFHTMQSRMVLGYVYAITARHRLAQFEFAKVCEMLQSSQAFAGLGYVLYAQGNTKEAVEALKKALEIDPRNANAMNSLGFISCEERLDLPRGIQLCRQAVELNPRNPAYHDSLGWAYYRAGNLTEAKASLRRALDLAPGNREIAVHLREVLDALKRGSPA
jgi:tetratricopeptide (TPR) repeat protein